MGKAWHGKANICKTIFLIALTVGLYWPTMRWLGKAWLNNEYYSHGFFLLTISLLLIWFSRKHIVNAPVISREKGIAVLIFACSLYLTGVLLHQPVILAFSLLFFIIALLLESLGTMKTKRIIFPVFLLALAIPIPSFQEFGILLQDWSTSGSSNIANLLGMDISANQNTITVNEENYQIALACSGLNRIMPLFSLTALLAYFLEGRYW